MPYSPESNWIEPEFCVSTIGSLKRLRNDNCNNSDTSDGHPWKVPTSETSVHYDYGDSFGYEVYMLKIAADELDEPGSPSSEDEPLSVDELQIEKEEVCLGELDGIETISCGDDDNLINMIIHSPPSRLEIDVNREELKSDAIRRHIEALKVDEEENSDSDSDSDGYESDFSYFTVSPVSVAPVVGRTVQVLVVDDSALQRKISRCLLSGKVGHDTWMVNTADSGERAIQVLESSLKLPDVIVIDQNMSSSGGKLLGHEVVERIRKSPAYSDMIIIGCTAYAEEARKHFLLAGCDAVWNKPMPSRSEVYSEICDIRRKRELAVIPAVEMKNSYPRLFSLPPMFRGYQEALPLASVFLPENMML